MCETLSWRLKLRPSSSALHKNLYLWSDHRTKEVRWLILFSLTLMVFNYHLISYKYWKIYCRKKNQYVFFIEISRDLLKKEALESKECRLNSRVVFPLQIQLPSTKSPPPYHRTPLVWWSLHGYKCLWSVGGKGRSSSLQEGALQTYTFRLD